MDTNDEKRNHELPPGYGDLLARLRGESQPAEALPAGLRARLLALPQTEKQARGEADEDFYLRALAETRESGESRPLPAELEGSRLLAYRALRATFAEAAQTRPLPVGLRERLNAIPRSAAKAPPWWVRDSRVAMAACLLMTLASTAFVGDAYASLAPGSPVRAEGREWAAQGREWAASRSGDLLSRLTESWAAGRDWLARQGEELRDRVEEGLDQFRHTELGRRWVGPAHQQGDDHERP